MEPHVIRLGTAWEPPAVGRGGSGTAWCRRFSRPSGLRPGDRVMLRWERVTAGAVVPSCTLNGAALPPIAADASRWEHDVTSLLRDRNELRLESTLPPRHAATLDAHGRTSLPDTWGWVALAIVTG